MHPTDRDPFAGHCLPGNRTAIGIPRQSEMAEAEPDSKRLRVDSKAADVSTDDVGAVETAAIGMCTVSQ
jgi:hypothetical protein